MNFSLVRVTFVPSNDSLDPGATFDEKNFSVKLTPGPRFGPNRSKNVVFGPVRVTFSLVRVTFFSLNDSLGPGASFGENFFRSN